MPKLQRIVYIRNVSLLLFIRCWSFFSQNSDYKLFFAIDCLCTPAPPYLDPSRLTIPAWQEKGELNFDRKSLMVLAQY